MRFFYANIQKVTATRADNAKKGDLFREIAELIEIPISYSGDLALCTKLTPWQL